MAEFGIHLYHRSDAPVADLVLVHGLMGDSKGTWAGEDDQGRPTYWPDWVKGQRPNVNVWLVDYDSSLIAWLQPAMPLDQIAKSLLIHAQDQGLGARPIHWVGHSMGGLVIKHLLCQARVNTNPDLKAIAAANSAVTFLGTPHHGAGLANWKDYFTNFLNAADLLFEGGFWGSAGRLFLRVKEALDGEKRQSHIDQLAAHNRDLGKLNDDFSHWLQAARDGGSLVRVRNYFETRPVRGVVTVVPNASAKLSNALVQEAGVQEDHFGICKFSNKNNAVFNGILVALDHVCRPVSDDRLDLAWRKALDAASPNVRAELHASLLRDADRKAHGPDHLEHAIAEIFGREDGATTLLARVKFVLHKAGTPASRLSPEERHERTTLYLMLLVRSAALVCRSGLQGKVLGDLTVPERERRLAIAVAAHVIFGQGVRLVVEPGGVRPDNLIDTIACEDAQAHMPGQAPARTPLEREVDAWLQRVSGATHTAQTTADLKAYLDAYEQEAHSRPILLDGERLLLDQTVRSLAADLRMGIVDIASDGRPANIPRGIWLDLCSQLDQQIADLTAIVPARLAVSSSSPPTQDASGPVTPSIPAAQVIVQQTINGTIGQSNVATGSHSPIHATQSGIGLTGGAHDPLAAAVLGLQMALHGDPALQADLRELHPLLLDRDLSNRAMSQIASVLPLLRQACVTPEASERWARLRAIVHAHWPDSRDFFH